MFAFVLCRAVLAFTRSYVTKRPQKKHLTPRGCVKCSSRELYALCRMCVYAWLAACERASERVRVGCFVFNCLTATVQIRLGAHARVCCSMRTTATDRWVALQSRRKSLMDSLWERAAAGPASTSAAAASATTATAKPSSSTVANTPPPKPAVVSASAKAEK